MFQAIMQDLLGDLNFVRTYIGDILITSHGDSQDHLAKMDIVLKRHAQAGFRCNANKCMFAQQELDYLGFRLTREGIQPQPKKVEAIMRLQAPKSKKQLRHFLGMVNYYRDMWQKRSHILAPLTALTSKNVPFKWTEVHQEAFKEMKRVISHETMPTFPDFNKPFHIFTDASNYQLGAVIMQEGAPIAFYSRKMDKAQQRYTTGEQELLSIVETLKELKNILLGQELIVHIDHKNILYRNLANDRIARWRLLLEEYGPQYVHISGQDNVVADALSRLNAYTNGKHIEVEEQMFATTMCTMVRDESYLVPEPNMEALAMAFTSKLDMKMENFPYILSS